MTIIQVRCSFLICYRFVCLIPAFSEPPMRIKGAPGDVLRLYVVDRLSLRRPEQHRPAATLPFTTFTACYNCSHLHRMYWRNNVSLVRIARTPR